VTSVAAAAPAARPRRLPRKIVRGAAKCLTGIVLCLTPVSAVIVLGWLTRKTARDIRSRIDGGNPGDWPNFLLAENSVGRRWWSRWAGGLIANIAAGLKAWIAVLALTLPFSLVWLSGWFAGWENSFSKGYEQAGVWPVTSLLAVFASLPVLVLLPMAIAHQSVKGTITGIFEMRRIAALTRAAGWRYLALTLIIAIGCIGVFGARALPVFAEQISARVASGSPEAIAEYAGQFKLAMTALLFCGLLVVRHIMARVYAAAVGALDSGRTAGRLKSAIVLLFAALLWFGLVFLIYTNQFLNYSWWSWINQPVTMLPWLGVLH